MTLAKGKGSSPYKGKEITADDPSNKIVGEDAPFSKSEHFEKEKGSRNPNNECAPLIDPWYDAHAHFLTVLSDYLPSLLSHLTLASSIPDLDICQDTLLPVSILFEFGSGTSLGWKEWVDKELVDTSFMAMLQQAGVLKAIISSRCLSNYRDLFNLCHLVRRWCTATHTFFLSYSEITVTLEDVANQLLLPILGDVDPGTIELFPE